MQKIVKRDNLVISTGGGVPCYHNNMELINGNGISIYMRMNSATLARHLEHDKAGRPLVRDRSGKELIRYISDKLQEREKFYLQAQYVVDGLNVKLEKLLEIINS